MNIEEDIKILKEKLDMLNKHISNYKKTNCKTAVYTELVKEAIAIKNILADRNNIASKYNNLILKIEAKIKENKEYLQHANTMYEYTEKDVINTVIEVLKLLEKENE